MPLTERLLRATPSRPWPESVQPFATAALHAAVPSCRVLILTTFGIATTSFVAVLGALGYDDAQRADLKRRGVI